MNRRALLGVLARAPALSAIAGHVAQQKIAAELAGISGMAGGPPIGGPPAGNDGCDDQIKAALRNAALRPQVEALLYEQHRSVCYIDADIAAMRSFSLAAKITFQRQRNVAREMDRYENGYVWNRLRKFAESLNPASLINLVTGR